MLGVLFFFFFKQKTAYEMRISDWSSDVCSSDLRAVVDELAVGGGIKDYGHAAERVGQFGLTAFEVLVVAVDPREDVAQSGVGVGHRLDGVLAPGEGAVLVGTKLEDLDGGDQSACREEGKGGRSEERRGGKECVSAGRSGGG